MMDAIPFTDVPDEVDHAAARAWWHSTLALLRKSRDLAIIGRAESCYQFDRGDIGNQVRADFGDDALTELDERIATRYGVDPETLRGERWVAEKIPPAARKLEAGVSFSAHKSIASLSPAMRDRVLAEAIARGKVSQRGVTDVRRELTGEAAPAQLDPDMTYADYLAARMVEHFAWLDAGQAQQLAAFERRVRGEFERGQKVGGAESEESEDRAA